MPKHRKDADHLVKSYRDNRAEKEGFLCCTSSPALKGDDDRSETSSPQDPPPASCCDAVSVKDGSASFREGLNCCCDTVKPIIKEASPLIPLPGAGVVVPIVADITHAGLNLASRAAEEIAHNKIRETDTHQNITWIADGLEVFFDEAWHQVVGPLTENSLRGVGMPLELASGISQFVAINGERLTDGAITVSENIAASIAEGMSNFRFRVGSNLRPMVGSADEEYTASMTILDHITQGIGNYLFAGDSDTGSEHRESVIIEEIDENQSSTSHDVDLSRTNTASYESQIEDNHSILNENTNIQETEDNPLTAVNSENFSENENNEDPFFDTHQTERSEDNDEEIIVVEDNSYFESTPSRFSVFSYLSGSVSRVAHSVWDMLPSREAMTSATFALYQGDEEVEEEMSNDEISRDERDMAGYIPQRTGGLLGDLS